LVAAAVPLLSGLAIATAPLEADACGGLFCDGGAPVPVDQTAEDILFWTDGQTVEAHVRIVYDGHPDDFAWIVPVMAVPEISVGSEPLFVQLGLATLPDWHLDGEGPCAPGGNFISGDDDIPPEPDILYQDTVGAFEVAVLQGGSSAEVVNWLDANGYAQEAAAEPILQEYLDEGFLFAAFKLKAGTDVDAIHPVVLRYAGGLPCVPLRLTRIAAEPDMGVRAYFLDSKRWFPKNYHHVELNLLKIPRLDENDIPMATTRAVDEADGHAFVTQYAGPSSVVDRTRVYQPAWKSTVFVDADPVTVPQLIADQGLNAHPLIQSILLEFLPPPPNVDPQDFWNDIEDYEDQIDHDAWDGPAFAAKLTEMIIDPGKKANGLFEHNAYLTRLYTTISPEEMTVDPTFHARAGLGDVANVLRGTALSNNDCDDEITMPDGRQFCVPSSEPWPTFKAMPWAERIELVPMQGAPQVLVDNTDLIDDQLTAYNKTVSCAESEMEEEDDEGGDGGDDGGSADTGGEGSHGSHDSTQANAGCGCSEASTLPAMGAFLLAGLGFVGPRRRSP
jgi:hypothetical protein